MKVYKFRDCFLNTLERQVVKNGVVLDLTPKAFDVLQLLIEGRGEIVTKDELLGKVWNGSFVEESNLAVQISHLRKALGQTRTERYVETVQGNGYRFVSAIILSMDDPITFDPSGISGNLSKIHDVDSESYRRYLKGEYLLKKHTVEAALKGLQCFKESVSRDPTNVLAHVGIVESYIFLYCLDHLLRAEALDIVNSTLDSVVAMNQDVAQLHAAIGGVRFLMEWDFEGAEKHFRNAIELDSGCILAHFRYCYLLITLGKRSEALKELAFMMRLDPVSVMSCKRVGRLFCQMGYFEEACKYLDDALELEPLDYEALALLGTVYMALGKYDDALVHLSRALECESDLDVLATIGQLYAFQGDNERADEVVCKIKSASTDVRKHAIKLSRIYSAVGDVEKAIENLELAYEFHDFDLPAMISDPRFQSIATETRFLEMARRVGIVR